MQLFAEAKSGCVTIFKVHFQKIFKFHLSRILFASHQQTLFHMECVTDTETVSYMILNTAVA